MESKNEIKNTLEGLSKRDLVDLAKKLKAKGYGNKNKDELIDFLIDFAPANKIRTTLTPPIWKRDKYKGCFTWSFFGVLLAIAAPLFQFLTKESPTNHNNKVENSLLPNIVSPNPFDPLDTVNLKIAIINGIHVNEQQVDGKRSSFDSTLVADLNEMSQRDSGFKVKQFKNVPYPIIRAKARELGESIYADLVIWNEFGKNHEKPPKTAYIITDGYFIDETTNNKLSDLDRLSDLRTGILQNNLNHIKYWIEGMAAYRKYHYDDAYSFFKKALDTMLYSGQVYDAETYLRIGQVLYFLGKPKESLSNLKRASLIIGNVVDTINYYPLFCNNLIAVIHWELQEYDKALEYFKSIVSLSEQYFGRVHPNTA